MDLANELIPRGRITRAGFWLRHLTLIPALLALVIIGVHVPGRPFDLIAVSLLFAVLISTWGRRLHDRDRSVWWLLAVAVPVIGALVLTIECGFGRSARPSDQGVSMPTSNDYLTV